LGSLTLALLDRGSRVTAVEIDPLLARQLPKTIAEHSHSEINRLTVLNRDILTMPRSELTEEPTALVANLPYNVAVPALLHLLAELPSIRTVMVMVQAEVAERLAAEPGGKDYGVPSVKVRFFGNVRRYGMVSPTVFWPIPRVYSGLVRIDRHEVSPWPTDPDFRAKVFELIDVAFAQRRKTSRNALRLITARNVGNLCHTTNLFRSWKALIFRTDISDFGSASRTITDNRKQPETVSSIAMPRTSTGQIRDLPTSVT